MKIEKITPQIAALYLGVSCENSAGSTYTLSNTDIYSASSDSEPWRKLTLLLRRLESLTEDEARELYGLATGMVWEKRSSGSCLFNWLFAQKKDTMQSIYHCIGTPDVWLKLLEWGVDLFGLIDAGLAKEVSKVG